MSLIGFYGPLQLVIFFSNADHMMSLYEPFFFKFCKTLCDYVRIIYERQRNIRLRISRDLFWDNKMKKLKRSTFLSKSETFCNLHNEFTPFIRNEPFYRYGGHLEFYCSERDIMICPWGQNRTQLGYTFWFGLPPGHPIISFTEKQNPRWPPYR